MKLQVVLVLSAAFTLSLQAPSSEECWCDLTSEGKAFPHGKLSNVERNSSDCNRNVTPDKSVELESLLLGLERRIAQLNSDVSVLEREDNGELYGVLSLYIVENELVEIQQLMDKLNRTVEGGQRLTVSTTHQLRELRAEMEEVETFDTMDVVKGQLANQQLKKDLDVCRKSLDATVPPTQPPQGTCPYGRLVNVTGPRVSTRGEYPGSYPYGAWGRDPEPEPGKENWYWLVVMTSKNIYSDYVRFYSSLSSFIVGKSVPGNVKIPAPIVQGSNNVLYRGALYYNCQSLPDVCRLNLTTKTVSSFKLPEGTRYNSKGNFCKLDECYPYSDLDLATDESGVWVTYTTTQDFGNVVLSKVEEGEPPRLGQTWHTTIYKQSITNTFVACGVLYATRFVSKDVEEIFYALDTATGEERFNVGILMKKMALNIQALNYSPVDQMLHAYSDSNMVSYKVWFA